MSSRSLMACASARVSFLFAAAALTLASCATGPTEDEPLFEIDGSPSDPLTQERIGELKDVRQRSLKAALAHGLIALQTDTDEKVGTGESLIIGLWDGGGVLASHQEFTPSRVINGPDIKWTHWHATHVAGTLAANGLDGFAEARGMAPDASILAMDYCGDVRGEIESAYEAYSNLAVTNHSYAQRFKRGAYTRTSSKFDDLVYDLPRAVLVVAAGNSGCSAASGFTCADPQTDGRDYRTIDAPGTAKNVVSVGSMSDLPNGLAVEQIDLLADDPEYEDIPIEPYSGVGPTVDGRIKPDVVANGDRLYSTYSEYPNEKDCNGRQRSYPAPAACSAIDAEGDGVGICYKEDSGTSMATPTVSGIVTVLQQYAINVSSMGRLLTGLEVRALLVHTAVSVDSKPKYKYGWGAVSTRHAVEHLGDWSGAIRAENTQHYIMLDTIPERSAWTLRRATGERGKSLPVRVTLAWNDPAGPKLWHDLDIAMNASQSGQAFLPWTLDPNNPIAPAVRGRNVHDNLERIDIFPDDSSEDLFELEIMNPKKFKTKAILLISGAEIVPS